MTRTATFIAALLAAAAVAVPAVAAHRSLTKAAVIARGTVICKAAERKVDALPSPRSQNPFAQTAPKGDRARAIAFTAGYANALSGVRRGLGALDAPPADRGLLMGFVSDLGPTIAAFRTAHADALAGRFAASLAATQKGFGLFARASAKTKAYGFPKWKGVCVSLGPPAEARWHPVVAIAACSIRPAWSRRRQASGERSGLRSFADA